MNKNVIIGIIVLAAVAAGAWFVTQNKSEAPQNASTAPAATSASGGVTELKIEDLQVGTGAEALPGKTVTVHYTGTLTNGQKFDSSLDRNQPFTVRLSKDGIPAQVIQGWDKGLVGMKVGGKRKLTIPPDMAYGPEGRPPVIPPNSTLIFEVQMLNVAD